jgi:hypothetical protein
MGAREPMRWRWPLLLALLLINVAAALLLVERPASAWVTSAWSGWNCLSLAMAFEWLWRGTFNRNDGLQEAPFLQRLIARWATLIVMFPLSHLFVEGLRISPLLAAAVVAVFGATVVLQFWLRRRAQAAAAARG